MREQTETTNPWDRWQYSTSFPDSSQSPTLAVALLQLDRELAQNSAPHVGLAAGLWTPRFSTMTSMPMSLREARYTRDSLSLARHE